MVVCPMADRSDSFEIAKLRRGNTAGNVNLLGGIVTGWALITLGHYLHHFNGGGETGFSVLSV